ncbi:MAG: triose-phosphate isomerase [Candidatus Margulisiibacteriota bacterium]|nr:triose-phosphate isomerase [Candidatus Margulisiibacteriota bacterium]
MRIPIMAGNWKMFKTEMEAVDFANKLIPLVKDVTDRQIIIFPNTTCLSKVCDVACPTNIGLGGQNIHWEDQGAFTGETSAKMLRGVGCKYVLIGHSERRQYFGETDETVNKKVHKALAEKLSPIICVGETLEQRESGNTMKIIETQVKGAIKDVQIKDWDNIIIAYEPVWAIGTGKTATPEQAQEVHAAIRKMLPAEVADKTRILYGGSVKPANVKDIMAQPDIDGGLVGGASLKVDSFEQLIKY